MHAVSQAISLARATWQSRGLPCAGQLACVPDNREGYHSLASSLAKLMRKLTRKSIPNRCWELPGAAPERPKSTENRSRDPLGTPRGGQEHSEGIPGASWKRLGAPQHAPESPGGSPRATRDARKSARERPGMPRSHQNRRQVAPGSAKIDVFPHGSFAKRCCSDFPSMFVDFRAFRKFSEPFKVPRPSAKSRIRPFALRVMSLAQR